MRYKTTLWSLKSERCEGIGDVQEIRGENTEMAGTTHVGEIHDRGFQRLCETGDQLPTSCNSNSSQDACCQLQRVGITSVSVILRKARQVPVPLDSCPSPGKCPRSCSRFLRNYRLIWANSTFVSIQTSVNSTREQT